MGDPYARSNPLLTEPKAQEPLQALQGPSVPVPKAPLHRLCTARPEPPRQNHKAEGSAGAAGAEGSAGASSGGGLGDGDCVCSDASSGVRATIAWGL